MFDLLMAEGVHSSGGNLAERKVDRELKKNGWRVQTIAIYLCDSSEPKGHVPEPGEPVQQVCWP